MNVPRRGWGRDTPQNFKGRDMSTPYRAIACEGKKSFHNKRLADKAAKRRRGASAYQCRSCNAWHVGTAFWTDGAARGRKKKRMSGKQKSIRDQLENGAAQTGR